MCPSIRSRSGADRLFGEAGNDHLRGGPGSDLYDGGTDTDTATACEVVSGSRSHLVRRQQWGGERREQEGVACLVRLPRNRLGQRNILAAYGLGIGEEVVGVRRAPSPACRRRHPVTARRERPLTRSDLPYFRRFRSGRTGPCARNGRHNAPEEALHGHGRSPPSRRPDGRRRSECRPKARSGTGPGR